MITSEIASIRRNIANEYQAALWGLTGLAYGTPRHAFITARMEKVGEGQQQLVSLLGEQHAMTCLAETLESLPDKPERHAILEVITHLCGKTEKTVHMIDHIQEMWETIDLLTKEFGEEDTHKIIGASTIAFSDEPRA